MDLCFHVDVGVSLFLFVCLFVCLFICSSSPSSCSSSLFRDVQNMAKDVHSALLDVLGKSLGHVSPGDQNKSSHSISANEEDFLAKMREEGRYLVDAW